MPFGDSAVEWAAEVKYLGVMVAADCGLGPELSARVRSGYAAFRRLRPLLGGGLAQAGPAARDCFARAMRALVLSTMLYGCEVWALAPAEWERVEVALRSLLRRAAGVRRRDRHGWELRALFGMETAQEMVARAQLVWLGHVARMPSTRVSRQLLGARRQEWFGPGRGNSGPSLLGCWGRTGAYLRLLSPLAEGAGALALTARARAEFFPGYRASTPWYILAQDRAKWRVLTKEVKIEIRSR